MNLVVVERCDDLSTVDVQGLAAASEAEGFRFVRRLWEEYLSQVNRFDKEGEALFFAQAGASVIGVGGLNRDPYTGNPKVGRVRHLYVAPPFRRHGAGSQIVTAIVAAARSHYDMLTLRTNNPAADVFYQTLGFVPTVDIPQATHVLHLNAKGGAQG
jgi:GNAT superfamily N-acetyltransferase